MIQQPLRSTTTTRFQSSSSIDPRLLLAAIVDSSQDAIVSEDMEGKITSWNPAAERIFGYTADDMVGCSMLRIVPPEFQSSALRMEEQVRCGRIVEAFETERLHRDGHRVQVAVTLSPVQDETGEVRGISKIIRDIAERKSADEVKFKLAAIVESSDDAIISKDLTGIITSWNASAERLFGYTAEEIIGRSILTLIPPHLQHEEPDILARLRRNEKIDHYETQRIKKSGEPIEVSLTISPIRDSNGVVIGASKIARDISERKKAQRALIESEKLAATARMAATIAHEINNPLESVTNLAYLLSTDPTLNKMARRYSEMLLAEISRASDIARQTLSFYRDSSTPALVQLPELIRNMLEIHGPKLNRRNVRLDVSMDDRAQVWGFSSELRQVFVNLLLNAVDAAGSHGGEVRIRMRLAGDNVHVVFSDNGSGIAKQHRAKVFDPFFTTKLSKGNGLGLWVSKGIVEKHAGVIRMRSRTEGKHQGTLFQVVLPSNIADRAKHDKA